MITEYYTMEKQEVMEQVKIALEGIRPYLQADGGDISIVELTDDMVVKVRLQGACEGCPMSVQTLKNGVEMVIKSNVPVIKEVVAV
ncbi:Fe-S cluster biogenesis protein NfuA, 4Fe-4S-binding domain [Alkalitalea saponilacus]|uniref:Fe-S cluster biogenesis protein NfuA, 4Fe-4S-binding domain n=3 Tax=Marinilabiliales TaxID=1970189 RepID=A0A1T5FS94_9BACT|nr:Fe-S cluster biogenesis protein NfuA [Natronoflexus pectinivorans]SKB99039.1 Fe-S cluster biogenesis protein NfuA, 4Fe-4S-binding domain [Alkalitalea saponilacus]